MTLRPLSSDAPIRGTGSARLASPHLATTITSLIGVNSFTPLHHHTIYSQGDGVCCKHTSFSPFYTSTLSPFRQFYSATEGALGARHPPCQLSRIAPPALPPPFRIADKRFVLPLNQLTLPHPFAAARTRAVADGISPVSATNTSSYPNPVSRLRPERSASIICQALFR